MIPALSIRQPWAWLIVHGYKDIENRDWHTPFRGNLLVHAGLTMTRAYYDQVTEELSNAGLLPVGGLPSMKIGSAAAWWAAPASSTVWNTALRSGNRKVALDSYCATTGPCNLCRGRAACNSSTYLNVHWRLTPMTRTDSEILTVDDLAKLFLCDKETAAERPDQRRSAGRQDRPRLDHPTTSIVRATKREGSRGGLNKTGTADKRSKAISLPNKKAHTEYSSNNSIRRHLKRT
ncbi:ASCH domain-containing protein [Delftia sp.]|uniref:ASCH domain-containing protein n=1 Tax=Delftia sp. TaxID=1886637 RepID=UPI00259CD0E7|nr:ASCH domain-containing protein [Delftia sp.]